MLVVHEMAFKKHWIGMSAWIWECYYQETVVNIYIRRLGFRSGRTSRNVAEISVLSHEYTGQTEGQWK